MRSIGVAGPSGPRAGHRRHRPDFLGWARCHCHHRKRPAERVDDYFHSGRPPPVAFVSSHRLFRPSLLRTCFAMTAGLVPGQEYGARRVAHCVGQGPAHSWLLQDRSSAAGAHGHHSVPQAGRTRRIYAIPCPRSRPRRSVDIWAGGPPARAGPLPLPPRGAGPGEGPLLHLHHTTR